MPEETKNLEQMLPLLQTLLAEGKTVSFRPNGVSMRPMLEDGRDTVFLRAVPETLRKNDVVLYRRKNGQFVLHRLVRIRNGQYIFYGDAQFAPEVVEKEQMLALVCGFLRKGKRYETDAAVYRAYAFFLNASRPLRHFLRRASSWLKRRFRAGNGVRRD